MDWVGLVPCRDQSWYTFTSSADQNMWLQRAGGQIDGWDLRGDELTEGGHGGIPGQRVFKRQVRPTLRHERTQERIALAMLADGRVRTRARRE